MVGFLHRFFRSESGVTFIIDAYRTFSENAASSYSPLPEGPLEKSPSLLKESRGALITQQQIVAPTHLSGRWPLQPSISRGAVRHEMDMRAIDGRRSQPHPLQPVRSTEQLFEEEHAHKTPLSPTRGWMGFQTLREYASTRHLE